ncbi:hypothetical protein FAGKG844_40038 [Frankia sp. AgKG'84/4]
MHAYPGLIQPGQGLRHPHRERRHEPGIDLGPVSQRTSRDSSALARIGPDWPGLARIGSARIGSARIGSARIGSARIGSARIGPSAEQDHGDDIAREVPVDPGKPTGPTPLSPRRSPGTAPAGTSHHVPALPRESASHRCPGADSPESSRPHGRPRPTRSVNERGKPSDCRSPKGVTDTPSERPTPTGDTRDDRLRHDCSGADGCECRDPSVGQARRTTRTPPGRATTRSG